MTQDDIIRMAREAGYSYSEAAVLDFDRHKRFAQLVAAAEREACAQVVLNGPFAGTRAGDAAAIRARGEA